ncbi:ABC transporter ATP-binding protein [Natrarchaeobius oligotrophus]|uniref:ABC transporter ATP-binding protein n=1 Tax=Natrarchaeobius chitinivorans TaxID=1679083 RepID=A0A3N6MRD1_NATCH|nr:ABC transporter ATP-binding protein [Natrarchaeobius chitinivorans]RQH00291.1 ABC transporter ATP-binding protein [Natrarchaeobius chitinivorans]
METESAVTHSDNGQTQTASETVIQTRGLTKSFATESGEIVAVDDVSFAIDEGTVVGVLGPNGAGKTTTIKMLLGLVRPTSGTASIHGVDVDSASSEIYDYVSGMLEGARNVYWRLTVRENLRFFSRIGNEPANPDRIERLIAQVGLEEKADEPINDLSRGMKQKASIACTLVRNTPTVFLDEPTLGLDVESSIELRESLKDLVRRDERTVLVSSHDMEVIQDLCDRVIIMADGEIIADDTVESLLQSFSTRTLRLTLDAAPPPELRTVLDSRFEVRHGTDTRNRHQLEVVGIDEDGFYEVFDLIEPAQPTLVEVDTLTPDLEDVFLRVVDEGEVSVDE